MTFKKIELISQPNNKQLQLARSRTTPNRLFFGDNLQLLRELNRIQKKVNLIYIDPPFATGADFSIKTKIGCREFTKPQNFIEERVYHDTWKDGIDSYLNYLRPRLVEMRQLLTEDGLFYIHLDWHVGHYVKVMLDEIFGYDNFRNEIIVNRVKKNNPNKKRFNVATDLLLLYAKTPEATLSPLTLKKLENQYWHSLDAPGNPKNQCQSRTFFGKEIAPPAGRQWMWTQERIDQAIRNGRCRLNPKTGRPEYLVESGRKQALDTNWTDLPGYSFASNFETEKSEALLERVILTSSKPGDVVADFFCGSGTSLIVAERLNRQWIGCDLSKFAIQVTRKRLLSLEFCNPFEIWSCTHSQKELPPAWKSKVLQKFHEEFPDLQGEVYIGSPDSPLSLTEIHEIAKESSSSQINFLAWDFDLGVNGLKQIAGKQIHLFLISKEIFSIRFLPEDKRYFTYLPRAKFRIQRRDKQVKIILEDFKSSESISVKHWSDLIDYWAIDWDYKNGVFHNQWQSFRTAQIQEISLSATHYYKEDSARRILVKIVDVFGNDISHRVQLPEFPDANL